MEFKDKNQELTFIEEQFNGEPNINVITKEQFEERVYKVFTILWEKLSKSFGPGGAGTFISIYPSYYNTKDGFTIMKNIAFDKKLDQVISDMVMNICSRLNFSVGDGTTTATIATKCTYDSYLDNKEYFATNKVLPRDIMKTLNTIKDEVLTLIHDKSREIRSDDSIELYNNIKDVVRISSNGDEKITEIIASLYAELMHPAITAKLSQKGELTSSIVEGYDTSASLTDKLYINNDDQTLVISNGMDVLVFDHKITKDCYEFILKPLSESCKGRGRKLVVIAPYYDNIAIEGVIKTDLNSEYKRTKDINLVLTVCSRPIGKDKIAMEDLSMLLHTTTITDAIEKDFLSELTTQKVFADKFFDLDHRDIKDINICVVAGENTLKVKNSSNLEPDDEIYPYFDSNKGIRVGYCDRAVIGLKDSTFSGFYYDEDIYNKYREDARTQLEETRKKCETMGIWSSELTEKQSRYYSLGLKTGVIEIGADSEIVQNYEKDMIDDAIRAASSAYNHGVVLGCNVTLIECLKEIRDIHSKYGDELGVLLSNILMEGFISVYDTVLHNISDDVEFLEPSDENRERMNDTVKKLFKHNEDVFTNMEAYSAIISELKNPSLYEAIEMYSVATNQVFDVTTGTFSNKIINSAGTDEEILKATIDLLSLLITGNQLVLR